MIHIIAPTEAFQGRPHGCRVRRNPNKLRSAPPAVNRGRDLDHGPFPRHLIIAGPSFAVCRQSVRIASCDDASPTADGPSRQGNIDTSLDDETGPPVFALLQTEDAPHEEG